MKWIIFLILLAGPAALLAEDMVPAGTILPVRLNTTINSNKAHPGDVITGRISQDVPLTPGQVIREGSKVTGHVVKIFDSRHQIPAKIAITFDTVVIGGKGIPIRTDLRAIAGYVEVEQAQIPIEGPDKGTPASAWTTAQIGGDIVYRGGGPVANSTGTVGKPVADGVLSAVSAQPGTGCRGEVAGNSASQALWLFSSDACGVYGLSDLAIVHAGRTDPAGEIVLSSRGADLKVPSGSGLLLRVNGPTTDGSKAEMEH